MKLCTSAGLIEVGAVRLIKQVKSFNSWLIFIYVCNVEVLKAAFSTGEGWVVTANRLRWVRNYMQVESAESPVSAVNG